MNILEILNNKPEVSWHTKSGPDSEKVYIGEFSVDEVKFELELAEYEASKQRVLVQVIFYRVENGTRSIKSVNGDVPAAKILGAVINGLMPKINEIKPDVILLAVNKNAGLVDSRKHLYDRMINFIEQRSTSPMLKHTGWIESSVAYYKLIGDNFDSEDQKDFVIAVETK